MNINMPSGRDGVHVYDLPQSEHSAVEECASIAERYLIVRDAPRGHENWAEIVELPSEGDCDA